MGWGVSHDQPDVAPELGALDPVFRLPGRHSQSDLHHQRGRVAEYVAAQSDQDPGLVSQPGSCDETAVPGSGAHRQEVDHAGAELEGRLAALRDSARRPRSESGVDVNRHSMKHRKKNISGMGALPPNPRDLSLSRQDSWTERRAALALSESRPLSRRSGCVSAEPYPPLRSVQSTRDGWKKCGRLHKILDVTFHSGQYSFYRNSLAASWFAPLAKRSCLTSPSCAVKKLRSTRPLACGEKAG